MQKNSYEVDPDAMTITYDLDTIYVYLIFTYL